MRRSNRQNHEHTSTESPPAKRKLRSRGQCGESDVVQGDRLQSKDIIPDGPLDTREEKENKTRVLRSNTDTSSLRWPVTTTKHPTEKNRKKRENIGNHIELLDSCRKIKDVEVGGHEKQTKFNVESDKIGNESKAVGDGTSKNNVHTNPVVIKPETDNTEYQVCSQAKGADEPQSDNKKPPEITQALTTKKSQQMKRKRMSSFEPPTTSTKSVSAKETVETIERSVVADENADITTSSDEPRNPDQSKLTTVGELEIVIKKELIEEETLETESKRPRRALRQRTGKPNYKEIDSDEERRRAARMELKRKAREEKDESGDDEDDEYVGSSESSDDSESSYEEPEEKPRRRQTGNTHSNGGTTFPRIQSANIKKEAKKEAAITQFEEATKKNKQKYENQVKAGEILSTEEKEKRREAYNALNNDEKKLHQEKLRAIQKQRLKNKRKQMLSMELRMLHSQRQLLTSLSTSNPDITKCLEILSDMKTIIYSPICLLKNPYVVECIRKMRHYKPDERIRQSAMEIYKLFECMFGIPDKTTFNQIFKREVTKFELNSKDWVQRRSDMTECAKQRILSSRKVTVCSPDDISKPATTEGSKLKVKHLHPKSAKDDSLKTETLSSPNRSGAEKLSGEVDDNNKAKDKYENSARSSDCPCVMCYEPVRREENEDDLSDDLKNTNTLRQEQEKGRTITEGAKKEINSDMTIPNLPNDTCAVVPGTNISSDGRTDEARTDESRTDEGLTNECSTDGVRTDEDRIREGRILTKEGRTNEGRKDEDQTNEHQTDGVRTDEDRTDGVRINDDRTIGVRTYENRTDEHQTDGVRTDEDRTDGVRINDDRTIGVRTYENRTDEHQTDGVRTDEDQTDEYQIDGVKTDDQTDDHQKDEDRTDVSDAPTKRALESCDVRKADASRRNLQESQAFLKENELEQKSDTNVLDLQKDTQEISAPISGDNLSNDGEKDEGQTDKGENVSGAPTKRAHVLTTVAEVHREFGVLDRDEGHQSDDPTRRGETDLSDAGNTDASQIGLQERQTVTEEAEMEQKSDKNVPTFGRNDEDKNDGEAPTKRVHVFTTVAEVHREFGVFEKDEGYDRDNPTTREEKQKDLSVTGDSCDVGNTEALHQEQYKSQVLPEENKTEQPSDSRSGTFGDESHSALEQEKRPGISKQNQQSQDGENSEPVNSVLQSTAFAKDKSDAESGDKGMECRVRKQQGSDFNLEDARKTRNKGKFKLNGRKERKDDTGKDMSGKFGENKERLFVKKESLEAIVHDIEDGQNGVEETYSGQGIESTRSRTRRTRNQQKSESERKIEQNSKQKKAESTTKKELNQNDLTTRRVLRSRLSLNESAEGGSDKGCTSQTNCAEEQIIKGTTQRRKLRPRKSLLDIGTIEQEPVHETECHDADGHDESITFRKKEVVNKVRVLRSAEKVVTSNKTEEASQVQQADATVPGSESKVVKGNHTRENSPVPEARDLRTRRQRDPSNTNQKNSSNNGMNNLRTGNERSKKKVVSKKIKNGASKQSQANADVKVTKRKTIIREKVIDCTNQEQEGKGNKPDEVASKHTDYPLSRTRSSSAKPNDSKTPVNEDSKPDKSTHKADDAMSDREVRRLTRSRKTNEAQGNDELSSSENRKNRRENDLSSTSQGAQVAESVRPGVQGNRCERKSDLSVKAGTGQIKRQTVNAVDAPRSDDTKVHPVQKGNGKTAGERVCVPANDAKTLLPKSTRFRRSVRCRDDDGTLSEPYSPRLHNVNLRINKSKSLPSNPNVPTERPQRTRSKTSVSSIVDVPFEVRAQNTEILDVVESHTNEDVGRKMDTDTDVLTHQEPRLACIRTKSRKKKRSLLYKYRGVRSVPNSPVFIPHEGLVSRSLPGSPLESDENAIMKTQDTKNNFEAVEIKSADDANQMPRSQENISDKSTPVANKPVKIRSSLSDSEIRFGSPGESNGGSSSIRRKVRRTKGKIKRKSAVRSEPSSPSMPVKPHQSANQDNSPGDYLRRMFFRLGNAWNNIFQSSPK